MRATKNVEVKSDAKERQIVKEAIAKHLAKVSHQEFTSASGKVFKLPSHLEVAALDQKERKTQAQASNPEWFYTYTTASTLTCNTNSPSFASGIITNTCLVDAKKNDSSVFVSCTTNSVTVTAYNNTNCNPNVRANDMEVFTKPLGTCEQDTVDNEAIYRGCSVASSAPFVFPDSGSAYATYSFYDDSTCNTALSYTGLLNGACLPASSTSSVRINYPSVTYYPKSTSCSTKTSGSTFVNFFNDQCTVNDDDIMSSFEGNVANNDDLLSTSYGYREAGIYTGGPTAAPTTAPTTAPGEGWVYTYATPGEQCSTSAPFARGYATGVCMPSADSKGIMYFCNSKVITKRVYDDAACATTYKQASIPPGCFPEYDASLGVNVGIEYGCSTSSTVEPKLPAGLTMASYEYYDDETCSTLLHYSAVENGRCIGLNGKSLLVNYPLQTSFPDSDKCMGRNTTHLAYSQTCTGGYFATYGPAGVVPQGLVVDDGVVPSYTYKHSALISVPSSSSSSDSLSTGAIIGISVGAAVVGLALVAFIYFFVVGKAVSLGGASNTNNPMKSRDEEN